MPHEHGEINAVDITLEYSRPLRALKLWLAFKVHGASGMREALEANLAQAQLLYSMAKEASDFEVIDSIPQLSIVPTRHIPTRLKASSAAQINKHTSRLQLALIADGRIYISPAQIDGDTWLRPCFTNFRTTNEDVVAAFHVIREVSNSLGND